MALIPNYPDEKEVEVSKEAWPLVKVAVESVTIALESGTSQWPLAFSQQTTCSGGGGH